MGPSSYFVKIRKRTIAISPLSPTPSPYTLTPFPWQTDTNYATLDLVEALNRNYDDVHQQMCMMTKHISYSSTMFHHALFNDPHGNERIATTLTPTNLKTQYLYLSTSWDSCINEGKIHRVPIFPLANELTYPGDNEYRQYFNDTAVLQRTTSRHLIRKSRILINQGLSISS